MLGKPYRPPARSRQGQKASFRHEAALNGAWTNVQKRGPGIMMPALRGGSMWGRGWRVVSSEPPRISAMTLRPRM